MTDIKIVDAICGSGKTTWVFEHIRSHPDRKWVFVSPYLDEAGDGNSKGRIQNELPELNFKSPATTPSKTADFLRLAQKGRNIAITHKLFTGFTPEVAEVLREQEYHLVIDETIDLVQFYDDINSQDVKFLILAGMVVCDSKTGMLAWNSEKWPNYTGRDIKIKQLCEMDCLWLYGDDVLIQRIPPTCMKACKTVTILTYLFEASLMHCWMQLNSMPWEYYQPETMRTNKQIKDIIRPLITLTQPTKLITDLQRSHQGLYVTNIFKKGWYDSIATEDDFHAIKKSIEITLKKDMGKGEVFWTTFKDYEPKLQGIGYTRAKKVKGELRKPFVSKNMRASNEYRDCVNCIYTVNIYPHGSLNNHLISYGVVLDQELYALSELIQFIFRGSIRDHKPMHLYILSDRMRRLFTEWLATDN